MLDTSSALVSRAAQWCALALVAMLTVTGFSSTASAQAVPVPGANFGTVTYSGFGPTMDWFTHNIPQRMDRLRTGYGAGPDVSLRKGDGLAATLKKSGISAGKPLFSAQGRTDLGGPLSVWVTGMGYFGNVNNDGASPGYKYDLGGFLAGIDYRQRNFVGGIHLGYVRSDSRSNDTVTSYDAYAFVIGGHAGLRWDGGSFGKMYLDGTLTVGIMDSDATIGVGSVGLAGSIRGGFSGLAVGGYVEAGTILDYGGVLLQPMVGLRIVHMSSDGFQASGAAGTFSIGSQDQTSVRSKLGVRVSHALPVSGTDRLTIKGRVAWLAELADTTSTGFGTQVGGVNALVLRSNNAGRHFAHVGGALHYQASGSIGFLVDYSATMSTQSVVHAIWGAIRVVW